MKHPEKSDFTTPTALAIEAVLLGLAAWEINHRLRNRGVKDDEIRPGTYPLAEHIDANTTVFVYPGGEGQVGIKEDAGDLIGVMLKRNEEGELVMQPDSTTDIPKLQRLVRVMRSYKDRLAHEEQETLE